MHSHLGQEQQETTSEVPQEKKALLKMTNDANFIDLNNSGTSKQTEALLRQYQLAQFCQQQSIDYSDLDNTEISLNIQSIIDGSHGNENIFSDMLQNQYKQIQTYNNHSKTLDYIPQPVHNNSAYSPSQNSPNSDTRSSFSSDVTSIKEEPMDPENLNGVPHPYLGGRTFTTPATISDNQSMNSFRSHLNSYRKQGKPCDKDSDEYRKKRIRNNIAVRKSREKANQRKRELEERNRFLQKENEKLNKQVELLSEELSIMKSLVTNFGISPEQISRELTKHFDSFQLHPQMYM